VLFTTKKKPQKPKIRLLRFKNLIFFRPIFQPWP